MRTVLDKLLTKLEVDNFKGWDVFDGLNSKLFQKTPFYKSRFFRLLWIQFFKRSPINFRKLTAVHKEYNAKGLALFIRGLINLYKINKDNKYLKEAYKLVDIIISQRAKDRDYFCVGYNFFWEARAFSVPAFTPNMILSSFVGQALLDLYEIDNNQKWLQYADEIGIFIEKELKLFESENEMCFGYIPNKGAIVHNANLMGASLFSRLYHLTKKNKYKELATKSVDYSANAQNKNGTWVYGESSYHQWIDNFHTGFNLVAINDAKKYLNSSKWDHALEVGLKYYLENHFLEDMTPKYFNNKLYPIDIHNFAQGILTFLVFGFIKEAKNLLNKCVYIMWDEKQHYFYYQKTRWFINKINYIRWAQAWMFFALTEYLKYD